MTSIDGMDRRRAVEAKGKRMKRDLVSHIRTDRESRKLKRPFDRTLFARIGGLIKKHDLDESFLHELGKALRQRAAVREPNPLKAKEDFRGPLFALCNRSQYRLALAIMTEAHNPYLAFASSPEEILLCNQLYLLNPRLDPDQLAHFHFETLLFLELTRERIELLMNKLEAISREMEEYERDRTIILKRLADRIGFLYSDDREAFLENLAHRLNKDCKGRLASFFGKTTCRPKPDTLTARLGIGYALAYSLIREDLDAIHESYKQELLEEGRQKLDSLRREIAEMRTLVDAVGSLSPESTREAA